MAPATKTIRGKGRPAKWMAMKAPGGESGGGKRIDRPSSDPPNGVGDNGDDDGLMPENAAAITAASPWAAAIQARTIISRAPGRMNANPGNHAAPGPVQAPADVGRQLLRFRTGQQHAVVEATQDAPWSIQARRSTNSCCIMAIWPAGPPKLVNPNLIQ